MVPLGTPAFDFQLPGVDGNTYSLESFKDKRILVIVFMCNHCPYVKATIQRMMTIQRDYEARGTQWVGINPNDAAAYPEDSFANMKLFFRDQRMNFPYLQDESQEIAGKYAAVCTPDIFVYGPERKLVYRGRIDDNWQDETRVTRKDLRRALDAIVSGQPAPQEQHPAMGCSIKWKR
jgi:peroxiredoxin